MSRFLQMPTGASVDGTVLCANVVRSWCICFLGDDRTLIPCRVLSHFCRIPSSAYLASLRSAGEYPLDSRGQVVARPVSKVE